LASPKTGDTTTEAVKVWFIIIFGITVAETAEVVRKKVMKKRNKI
jgi:hypothetical protein